MRRGLRDSCRLRSALRCAARAEWNGTDVHGPVFSRRGRYGRYDSFSLDANHGPRFSSRLTAALSLPTSPAVSLTLNPCSQCSLSIRIRPSGDRCE